jgi:hypothetical protein
MHQQPGLFGLTNSNRDFTKKDSWGKNQFNNSFPASLACYMYFHGIYPVYLLASENANVERSRISVDNLFGMKPLEPKIHFSFEQAYTPFSDLVLGQVLRIDLVIQDTSTRFRDCIRALEIKLNTPEIFAD